MSWIVCEVKIKQSESDSDSDESFPEGNTEFEVSAMVTQAQAARHAEIREYIVQETLRDGRKLFIRAIRPDDKAILEELMRHLSPESRYFRFFTAKDSLTEQELARFTEIDFTHHVGLVASVVELGFPVPAATGRYILFPENDSSSTKAELSFAVEDEFQGTGIATLLLQHLAKIARAEGIDSFVAFVLSENQKMLDVFAHSGFARTQTIGEQGVIEVSLRLS